MGFPCLCNEENCNFYNLCNTHGKSWISNNIVDSRKRKHGLLVKIPDYPQKNPPPNNNNHKPAHNPLFKDVSAPRLIHASKLYLYFFWIPSTGWCLPDLQKQLSPTGTGHGGSQLQLKVLKHQTFGVHISDEQTQAYTCSHPLSIHTLRKKGIPWSSDHKEYCENKLYHFCKALGYYSDGKHRKAIRKLKIWPSEKSLQVLKSIRYQ